MNDETTNVERRTVLQLAASIAGVAAIGARPARADAVPPKPTGKPGDFDFLTGKWKIANKQPKDGGFDEFEGEATVYGLLAGIASIEELRIPARKFSGLGLRLLDVEKKLWADYWIPSRTGLLTPPPAWGSFVDGVGTWDGDDVDGEAPIIVRGAWDEITPKSCRWRQAVSRDDGKTWVDNWIMHWTRV